jgi:hypothetical protein
MKTMPLLLLLPVLAACSSASAYMRPSKTGMFPVDEEARVVFCRPDRKLGSAVTFDVWDRLKLIGFAERGSSFEVRCAPGKHLFLAQGENAAAIDAELGAGKTYYVWVTPRLGVLYAAVGLTPLTKDSDLAPKVWKELAKTQRRELIPDLAAEYEKSHREDVRKLLEEFEGERKEEMLKLRPEDGYTEELSGDGRVQRKKTWTPRSSPDEEPAERPVRP